MYSVVHDLGHNYFCALNQNMAASGQENVEVSSTIAGANSEMGEVEDRSRL